MVYNPHRWNAGTTQQDSTPTQPVDSGRARHSRDAEAATVALRWIADACWPNQTGSN